MEWPSLFSSHQTPDVSDTEFERSQNHLYCCEKSFDSIRTVRVSKEIDDATQNLEIETSEQFESGHRVDQPIDRLQWLLMCLTNQI